MSGRRADRVSVRALVQRAAVLDPEAWTGPLLARLANRRLRSIRWATEEAEAGDHREQENDMADNLQAADAAAEAVAVAARVSLADIEEAIDAVYYTTGNRALSDETLHPDHLGALSVLTICIAVMKNGYTVIGKSAPASRENFNGELGRKLASEDCMRQIWPLMGFALRERIALRAAQANAAPHSRL